MKYLQLYDHLGNLVKEFEVYVDGQDFNWGAPKPEPVWLGTIRLSATKAVESVEPTPEVEKLTPEEEEEQAPFLREIEERIGAVELEPEVAEEAEVQPQVPFTTPETITVNLPKKKVKRESKKPSHKSRRSSRASSPTRPKRS